MTDAPKVKIPARLDGDMLVAILRKFPDCEMLIEGVVFTLDGTEFRTQTLEGALTLIRAIATGTAKGKRADEVKP